MKNVYFKVYEDVDRMEQGTPAFRGVVNTEDMYVVGVNQEPLRFFDENGEKVLLLSQIFGRNIPSWVDETMICFEIINECAKLQEGSKTLNMGGYYLTVQYGCD